MYYTLNKFTFCQTYATSYCHAKIETLYLFNLIFIFILIIPR